MRQDNPLCAPNNNMYIPWKACSKQQVPTPALGARVSDVAAIYRSYLYHGTWKEFYMLSNEYKFNCWWNYYALIFKYTFLVCVIVVSIFTII